MTSGQLQKFESDSISKEIDSSFPENFSPESKIWIYQSNRPFSENEKEEVNYLLQAFTKNWLSHGKKVKGLGKIIFNQFIILVADESASAVSGCSTDSSVRIIKEIEQMFNIQLFDRQKLAFFVNDEIKLIPLNEFEKAIDLGILTSETLYFNNTIESLDRLKRNWLIRIDQSWLSTRLNKIKP